jgi:hypothetical protein
MANNGPNYFWNQFTEIYDILLNQILLRYETAKQNQNPNVDAMKDELESFGGHLERYMGQNPPHYPRPNALYFPEFYDIYTILQNTKQELHDAEQQQDPNYPRMREKYRDRTDGFELYLSEELLRKLRRDEPLLGGKRKRKTKKTRKTKRKARTTRRR